jgi:hypothetical protein
MKARCLAVCLLLSSIAIDRFGGVGFSVRLPR